MRVDNGYWRWNIRQVGMIRGDLIAAVKGFEGLRLDAYICAGGRWTIGYGHTKGVQEGDTCTKEEATAFLLQDLADAAALVDGIDFEFNANQRDALTDFVFNLGIGNLLRSTLLRKIKAGASESEIRQEFRRWVYAGGEVQRGLVRRREWEENMYFCKVEIEADE